MLTILFVTLPIFALIFLGAGLRRFGAFGEDFWRGAERLVYYVLFPPLLFPRSPAPILRHWRPASWPWPWSRAPAR